MIVSNLYILLSLFDYTPAQGSLTTTPLIKTKSCYLARNSDGRAPMSIRIHTPSNFNGPKKAVGAMLVQGWLNFNDECGHESV